MESYFAEIPIHKLRDEIRKAIITIEGLLNPALAEKIIANPNFVLPDHFWPNWVYNPLFEEIPADRKNTVISLTEKIRMNQIELAKRDEQRKKRAEKRLAYQQNRINSSLKCQGKRNLLGKSSFLGNRHNLFDGKSDSFLDDWNMDAFKPDKVLARPNPPPGLKLYADLA